MLLDNNLSSVLQESFQKSKLFLKMGKSLGFGLYIIDIKNEKFTTILVFAKPSRRRT